MTAQASIVYQAGNFTVRKARKGYEVYRDGAVAAQRVAIIGSEGPQWIARAIAEADRRAAAEVRHYCFVTPRGLYIGKVETTEEEIRALFRCSIEGNTVTVFGERS